jgi:hypothetical protein
MSGVSLQLTSYGKSCERCKVYFIATDPNQRTCPWCQMVEEGKEQPELYEKLENV